MTIRRFLLAAGLLLLLLGSAIGSQAQDAPPHQAVYLLVLAEQPVQELTRNRPADPIYRGELDRLGEQLQQVDRKTERTAAIALQAAADALLVQRRADLLQQAQPALERSQEPVVVAVEAAGGELVYRYRAVNALAVRLPESAVAPLAARPDVASIEPDQLLAADLNVSGPSLGATSWWAAGLDGSAWDVAVIDSGVDSGHWAFTGHPVQGGRFLEAAGVNAMYDLTDDDVNGHGTNVAGIVSSIDAAYRGIASGHDTLFNLKAGYDPDGVSGGGASMYWSDAMAAVDWALSQDDTPDVFNLSYGSCTTLGDTNFSRFWDAVVDQFEVGVAMAAGNNRFTCSPHELHQPSIAYNVLSVANVDDRNTLSRADDVISATSSRGPTADGRRKPDLAAPGANISSANNLADEGGPRWTAYSGTSQAAPHVAGALLLALDSGILEPPMQKALLINSAEDRGTAGWDAEWGWGYLDLARAYATREYVTASDLQANPDYDLYRLNLSAGDKATLVWNRHVDYAGDSYPLGSGVHQLGDLDLYLYNYVTNALVDTSLSAVDNVEQVQAAGSLTGVLRVQAASFAFDNFLTERYGLAATTSLQAMAGPRLAAGPDQAHHLAVGETVVVTAPVSNEGDLTVHAVSVSVQVPAGYALTAGTNPIALGNLPPGVSTSVSWTLQKTAESVVRTMPVSAAGSGYGLAFSDQVMVYLVKPPNLWLPLIFR